MRHNDVPKMILIADGTDAKRSCPILRVIWLDDALKMLLETMFAAPAFESIWRIPLNPRFYDAIRTGAAPI
jgi:hypothetical protein